jgi:hypothetical protein
MGVGDVEFERLLRNAGLAQVETTVRKRDSLPSTNGGMVPGGTSDKVAREPQAELAGPPETPAQVEEGELRYDGVADESGEPEPADQLAEAICAKLQGESLWCRREIVRLASGVDGVLRTAAGEGNEILYRFLQVLLYVALPIFLAALLFVSRTR